MNKTPGGFGGGGGKGSKDDARETRLGLDPTKEQEVLDRARKRMDRAIAAEADNRKAALDDTKNYMGNQWDAGVQAQRAFDGRPCLTINKFPTLLNQVTNDVRQNRPDINISPVGDKSDPEVAKMYAGMIREIERKSVADIAYDTAFAQAARAGWGWWRVVTEYEKPGSLNQVLTIRRIRNQFTVYPDPASQEPDAADMKWCFVSEMLSRDEFKEDYPNAQPMAWPAGGVGDSLKSWVTKDEIRIAEYYEIENEKRTYVMLENGAEGWEDEMDPETLERFAVVDERESDWPRIHWYKLTATEVLQDVEVLGKWIPLIRTVGDEVDIEGKPTWWGIVRHAKDAQKMYNYWVTAFTEAVALAPKAPWVIAEGQDEGYEQEWKNSNRLPMAVIRYKPVDLNGQLAPPPTRVQPVAMPQGIQQGLTNAGQDMMATTGIRFDGTVKDKVYDESGRALRELRRFGDLGSFHLVDNLARAMRHTGEILVDLIPKIYSRKRVITILRENDEEERVTVDPNMGKPFEQRQNATPDGKMMKFFNPTYGEYGVTVTIGPSYATKRIEAAESMMDFIRALGPGNPAVTAVMDLISKNSDWPGSDEFTKRLSVLVNELHPGLIQPEMKDVSPQIQAAMAAMQKQIQQAAQEKVQMMKALTERETEFKLKAEELRIKSEANEQSFEAKLLAVAQKAEAAAAQTQAHVGSQINDMVQAVTAMRDMLSPPQEGATVQ